MSEREKTDRAKDLKAYEEHRASRQVATYMAGAFSHDRLEAEIEVMLRAPKGTKRAGLNRYHYLDILVDERERRLSAGSKRASLISGELYKCAHCRSFHVGGIDLRYTEEDGASLLAACGGTGSDLSHVGVARLEAEVAHEWERIEREERELRKRKARDEEQK